jgi:hypothetical protein
VVRAAITAGCHYVDISGERLYLLRVFDEFADDAAAAGVTVVPGANDDALPSSLIGHLTAERVMPVEELVIALDLSRSGAAPSRGTLRSALANQFFLHPRIEALRAGGDQRALHAILVQRFPILAAVELLLGMTVLFVAPFLHGSARNEAHQAQPSVYKSATADSLPELPAKRSSASTWSEGAAETIVIAGIMIAGYRVSGRLARRRATPAAVTRP